MNKAETIVKSRQITEYPPPWVGLAHEINPNAPTEEWLKAAGLDWKVAKYPQMVDLDGLGDHFIKTGSEALIRHVPKPTEDDVLTILPTASWNPVQNEDALEFFRKFCATGEVEMRVAGALMGGRHVFAMGKIINDRGDITDGDPVQAWLIFSNPHQFGYSMDVRLALIREIGMSTFVTPIPDIGKINHRRVFTSGEVSDVLSASHAAAWENIEKMRRAAQTLVTREEAISYFNKVFPKTSDRRGDHSSDTVPHSKAAKAAMEILNVQPGSDISPNSLWNCMTAVAYLVDHRLGKGTDTRLYSAWYGVNQTVKENALC